MLGKKGAVWSLSIWGGLLGLAPALVELTDKLLATGALGPKETLIVTAVGSLLALVGRVRATKVIGGLF